MDCYTVHYTRVIVEQGSIIVHAKDEEDALHKAYAERAEKGITFERIFQQEDAGRAVFLMEC